MCVFEGLSPAFASFPPASAQNDSMSARVQADTCPPGVRSLLAVWPQFPESHKTEMTETS